MLGPAIHVEGARELSVAFRRASGSTKNLSRAHREVGRLATDRSKSAASSASRQQQRAAKALIGQGTSREARVSIRNTTSMPFGIGAFVGALRYRQFPPWVGDSWDITSGDGPYVVAPAIAGSMPEIVDEFERAVRLALEGVGLDADFRGSTL